MGSRSADNAPERRRFQMTSCLGVGGFGEVYLAKMTSAGGVRTDVAVKVLHRGLDPRSQAVRRLRDEAQLLGLLNHPGILKIHDLVLLEGRAALVTEYIEGADLDVCVQHAEHPLSLAPVMEVFARVSDALSTAFSHVGPDGQPLQLLHRDIKPSNIRVGKHGGVTLLDFGIAKAAVDRKAKTQTNAVIGSLSYMAPERFDHSGDTSSDVYSIGATLFEAVTGSRLFPDMTVKQHYAMALNRERHDPHVQTRLEQVETGAVRDLLAKILHYEPASRPTLPDLADLFEDLAAETHGERLSRWCREHEWPAPNDESGELVGRTVTETTLTQIGGSVTGLQTALNPPPQTMTSSETMALMDLDETVDEPEIPAPAPPPAPTAPTRAGSTLWLPATMLFIALLTLGGAGVCVAGLGFVGFDTMVSWTTPRAEHTSQKTVIERRAVEPPTEEILPDEPPPVAPRAPTGPSVSCDDLSSLARDADAGNLSAEHLQCLSARMRRADLKQTERDAAGRVVLAESWQQCERASKCSTYDNEQRYFFEAISRSDVDLLNRWSGWLATTAETDAALDEAITSAERTVELRSDWQGVEHVENVDRVYERLAKLTFKRWKLNTNRGKTRREAKEASIVWMDFRNQLGRDSSEALAMCAEAESKEACTKRSHEVVDVVGITFVSVPMGAMVYVDGVQVGQAPTILEIPHGDHEIEMRTSDSIGKNSITVGLGMPARWTWRASEDSWTGGA